MRPLAALPQTRPAPASPPSYLGKPERELWAQLVAEYAIADSAGLVLLEQLCRCLQVVRECREVVQEQGKMQGTREHALLKMWRDFEKQAHSALRSLNFDLEPLRDRPGRQPGSWGKGTGA